MDFRRKNGGVLIGHSMHSRRHVKQRLLPKKTKEAPILQAKLHIAVVGAQDRIGTTNFALRIASYFKCRDGARVVVCANK